MATLLLELLSEEIPAKMQEDAIEQLYTTLKSKLSAIFPEITIDTWITPRRMGAFIDNIVEPTLGQFDEKRGPRVGSDQKAVDGFMKTLGINSIEQLSTINTDKGEFYIATIPKQTESLGATLKTIIEEVLLQFKWLKPMRWGEGSISWVRPIHNILCLFNEKVLPIEFANLKANNQTLGHRFMGQKAPLEVVSHADYLKKMQENFVILTTTARQGIIIAEATKQLAAMGLQLKSDPPLLGEIAGLVEFPVIFTGKIAQEFLELPSEVLIATLRNNQKYLLTEDNQGRLAPYFVITSNILPEDKGLTLIAGNERVTRSRLRDAQFFYDYDRKISLFTRVEMLKKITFHAKIGTIYEKVQRVANYAETLAKFFGVDQEATKRAATLCKADLVTEMVKEFPETQGVMGYYYALHDQEDKQVAVAIKEHLLPQGISDEVPKTLLGAIVAIADKLDNIVSLFAIGEKPTGSRDPFALRRSAIGIVRIILFHKLNIQLATLHLDSEVLSFIYERLEFVLKEELKSCDNEMQQILLTLLELSKKETVAYDLYLVYCKFMDIKQFLLENGMGIMSSYQRINNILDQAKDVSITEVDAGLFTTEEERKLYSTMQSIKPAVQEKLRNNLVYLAIEELFTLEPILNQFFDKVMVNDPDAKLRLNRLALLRELQKIYSEVFTN